MAAAAGFLVAAGFGAAGLDSSDVQLPIMSFFVTWMTYLLINLMSMIKCVW